MKKSVRAVAVLTALVCLLTCFSVFPAAGAGDQKDSDVRYTQKIVSVLYDNSGSMTSDNKNEYALYALQMLMALLDDGDVLVITPMNLNSSTVTNMSAGIEINLAASNRNAEIKAALTSASSFLSRSPSGGTPGSAISIAVDQLEARGLKNRDNLGNAEKNKEYWLVVLTDGAFNEQTSSYGADAVVESHIKDFPSLRTIYFGLGSDSPDLSGSQLTKKMPFTPYRAASTDDIVSAMQSVANQLSGRYTLESKYYSVNGSTVTVDLNKCELAFKTVSVIAQDCGVTLVSAKHDGKTVNVAQPCVIEPKGLTDKIKNGYSGVIAGSPYLSGGKLTLEFSGPVSANKLNILAEPALVIDSYLEYKNGANWEKTTMQYINANLSQNDKIRVGYDVYEQAGGGIVDLSKIFGESKASVTYAGKTYNVGDEIPLVVGNNEIGISVSVMDGAYTMYSSIICIIEQNPTYYRVENKCDEEFSVTTKKAQAVFTVYSNNMPLSAANLSKYDWKVSVKAPDGSDADFKTSVGADGKVTVDVTAARGAYGDYQIDFTITSEYGISRSASHTVKYYPKSIEIKGTHPESFPKGVTVAESEYTISIDGTQLSAEDLGKYTWELKTYAPGGSEAQTKVTIGADGKIKSVLDVSSGSYGSYETKLKIVVSESFQKEYTHAIKNYPTTVTMNALDKGGYSVSQYQLTVNERPMSFELFSDGQPFVFNNGITTYKVVVGGTDVTQYAVADGNVLKYAPRVEHFSEALSLGEMTVNVSVSCSEAASLNASASNTMKVIETVYKVEPVEHSKKSVDRFRLGSIDAALYFRVLRDGDAMPVDELAACIESGEIKIKDKKGTFGWQIWLPCGKEITTETVGGEPVITFRATRDWIKPLDNFAAMLIFNGDKPVTVEYMGVEGTDAITFTKSPIWSYVWRILLILFIIHCGLYIAGFFNGKCKSLPSGVFVSASLNNNGSDVRFNLTEINFTFWEKYGWHLARFIPHSKKLWWYHQPDIEDMGDIVYGYFESDSPTFRFNGKGMRKIKTPVAATATKKIFFEYLNDISKYDGKGPVPEPKMKIKVIDLKNLLQIDGTVPPIPQDTSTPTTFYYGKERKPGMGATSFVYFVKKIK